MSHLLVLLCLSAWAAEPQIDVDAEGAVVGRIMVPANADAVRRVIGDAIEVGKLSPEVVSVHSDPERDGCVEVVTETRGLFRPLKYRSRRCPTADGWEEALLQSDDFDRYESKWSMREVDGQTEVTLSVQAEVDLPVPKSLVEARQKKSIGEILENLLYQVLH